MDHEQVVNVGECIYQREILVFPQYFFDFQRVAIYKMSIFKIWLLF